jgi:hypothetical protein
VSTTAVSWPYYLRVKPIVQWPGTPTPYGIRKVAAFRAGFGATVSLLERELEHLTNIGRRQAILQMALRDRDIRLDGYPRADARPEHPGVIVSIESKWGPLSYPCDTFDDWQDNLRAIAKGLEALRLVDRYGVTKNGEQYTGFKQLGSGPTMSKVEAAEKLYGMAYPDTTAEDRTRGARLMLGADDRLQLVYRRAARAQHPDTGGSAEAWEEFRTAWDVVMP